MPAPEIVAVVALCWVAGGRFEKLLVVTLSVSLMIADRGMGDVLQTFPTGLIGMKKSGEYPGVILVVAENEK